MTNLKTEEKPKKFVQAGPCACGGLILKKYLNPYRIHPERGGPVVVQEILYTCTKGGEACVSGARKV